MNGKLFLLTLFLFLLLLSAGNAPQPKNTVDNARLITGPTIEAYQDENQTLKLDSIDWGTCYPGQTRQKTIWLRNNNQTHAQTVNITATNWLPPESRDITFTATPNNATILPNNVAPVTVQITIPWNPTNRYTKFSFTINITATDP